MGPVTRSRLNGPERSEKRSLRLTRPPNSGLWAFGMMRASAPNAASSTAQPTGVFLPPAPGDVCKDISRASIRTGTPNRRRRCRSSHRRLSSRCAGRSRASSATYMASRLRPSNARNRSNPVAARPAQTASKASRTCPSSKVTCSHATRSTSAVPRKTRRPPVRSPVRTRRTNSR